MLSVTLVIESPSSKGKFGLEKFLKDGWDCLMEKVIELDSTNCLETSRLS